MNCTHCKDTGYEIVKVRDDFYDTDTDVAQMCKHCDIGRKRRYIGIPEESIDWTFENFPKSLGTTVEVNGKQITTDMIRMAFTERDKWIILMGPVGTGKTSLAVSGYKLLRDMDVCGRFWNTAALLDATKASFGNEGRVNAIEKLHAGPDLLVLDGLGERKLTDNWEKPSMAQLIGQRYSHRLRTVITTNWNSEDFAEQLGDWVLDRLRHVSIVMNVTGTSMRGRL
jgi:DNA replication protein DnaC